jgi:hypothetical protein
MKYNSLYIAIFSTMIFFNACNVQAVIEQSTENKETEILSNILKHPHESPIKNFSMYPENYFKGLSDAVVFMQELKQDATPYITLLNNEAITYVNYVANNEKLPTIEEKLAAIKKELPSNTLSYLEITLAHNQPSTKPLLSSTSSQEQAKVSTPAEPQIQTSIFTQAFNAIWDGITNTF